MIITVQWYSNAIAFAKIIKAGHKALYNVEILDIVHNVIVSEKINEDNWKSLIITEIKSNIKNGKIISLIGNFNAKPTPETRACKCCGETHFEGEFKAGFNKKTNQQQYRNTCNTCHKVIRKSYKKYLLSEEQKAKFYETAKLRKELEKKLYGKIVDNTAKERYQRWKLKHKK